MRRARVLKIRFGKPDIHRLIPDCSEEVGLLDLVLVFGCCGCCCSSLLLETVSPSASLLLETVSPAAGLDDVDVVQTFFFLASLKRNYREGNLGNCVFFCFVLPLSAHSLRKNEIIIFYG